MKIKLLPHSVQKPAAILFVCSLVLVFVLTICMVASISHDDNEIGRIVTWISTEGQVCFRILVLIFNISLALLLFSEEKVEDEMISHLRLRAAAISTAIVIGLIIIESTIWILLPEDVMSSLREIRNDFKGLGASTLIILYLMMFRVSIHKYNTGPNEE